MKKKVLALVVLAAMLISILPMAAFAANPDYNYSSVTVKEESAAADGYDAPATDSNDYLEYEVTLRDNAWADAKGTFFIATSRPTVDKIYIAEGGTLSEQQGVSEAVTVTATASTVKVRIYAGVAGTTKIAFGTNAEGTSVTAATVANYAQGKEGSSASTAGAIGGQLYTGTFTSAAVADNGLSIAVTGGNGQKLLANGSKRFTITATLKATNNAPVSGKEVTFSVTPSGATLSATTVTTDANGKAEVKLSATKPGKYKVTAKADGATSISTDTDDLQFESPSIDVIKAESDDNQKIAQKEKAAFEFSFYDANSNKFDITSAPNFNKGEVKTGSPLENAEFSVITKPSGAKLDADKVSDQINVTAKTNGNLELEIKENILDKDGDYTIRFTLANGKSVSYNFNVKKQGTITGMTLKYDSVALPGTKDKVSTEPSIKLVDAEGYAKKIAASEVTFSVDNTAIAAVNTDGTVKVLENNKTGNVIVTAIHTDKKVVATATIEIVKPISAVKIVPPTSAVVGEDNNVVIQLVDMDGKVVSALENGDANGSSVVVISKPEGAIVDSSFDADFTADIKNKGTSSFDIYSNTEGTVKVQVIVKVGTVYYTGSSEIYFGKSSGIKGNNIIFIIGASSYVVDGKPVAATSVPFIENGRTYLGVRDMGLSMGITGDENIVWNNATQTAKLVKDGITVEVTVGASAIKVTKNSVTTEVAIDAPAQNAYAAQKVQLDRR
ncbi:MAG: Ig-like domain-containing protein [Peptococcaceae bacterium]|nr:Ig-like domain-containing protein [Peptococcaceae bacterium]